MIISASIECKWCGTKVDISEKATTRSFNIALNKLKRIHDWNCESKGKAKERIDETKAIANDAIKKMMSS